MDLRDYLGIARAHRVLIASIALAVLGLALLATLLSTPQYAATTRLFISTSASGDDAQAFQGSQFSVQRVKSYADLVTGREIAQRVVEKLDLDENPSELAAQITATTKLDTVILSITVTDPSPDRAQQLSTAVSQEFVAFIGELETPPGRDQASIKATIVDSAAKPTSPVSPNLTRNVGLAVVIGLLLGVGVAVLRDTLDTSVKSPDDIAAVADVPVLGSVPFAKAGTDNPLIQGLGPYDPRVEAFRVLRTNIQFIDPGDHGKVFVITSAVPSEGKSTTAVNLAIALAQTGSRVALVEGDLRRPRVSEYLNLVSSVGLTSVIVGHVDLAGAMQSSSISGLEVLASGRIPPNPAELLQSDSMRDIVETLRSRHDIVLIDAPPLLPVTDGALIADLADGALLVVRHGKTSHEQLRGSIDRLESVGAKALGVILNMTPSGGKGTYGYGYGYGYSADDVTLDETSLPDRGKSPQSVFRAR